MAEALVRLYVLLWFYWLAGFIVTVYILAWALGPALRHVTKKLAEGWFEVPERRSLQQDRTICPATAAQRVPDRARTPERTGETEGPAPTTSKEDAGHRWLGGTK
jgi:hypothetical protein